MLSKFRSEKLKSLIFLTSLMALIITISLISTSFVSDVATEESNATQKVTDVKIDYKDSSKVEEASFKSTYGDKLTSMEQKNEKLARTLEEVIKKMDEMKNTPAPTQPQQPIPELSFPKETGNPQANSQKTNSGYNGFEIPQPSNTPKQEPIKKVALKTSLAVLKTESVKNDNNDTVEQPRKKKQLIISAGSFVDGILLNGLDAPSSGAAKSQPHPVAIRLSDKSYLPNRFKADIKDCVAIGLGYGELSSDRAIIKIDSVNCMKKDGTAIASDGSNLGYVTGEDGKIGLDGRVVSKQGTILARALAAGFMEGMGKVFQQSNTYVATSTTGSVSTPEPNKALESSIYGGMGEASKKVAEYYLKLNDEMFPVVEIALGRKCNIIFTKPITFKEVGE